MEQTIEHNETAAASRWAGLQTRVISGLVLGAVVLTTLLIGGWPFILLVSIAGLIMIREWDALCEGHHPLWHWSGLVYAGLPASTLIWLRGLHTEADPLAGIHLVLFVMFAVFATDIGAYFAGRRIGGPKLAPTISPGKTWAGLGGGVLAAMLSGAACSGFTPYPFTIGACMLMGALLAVVAQLGDLFESWLKRRAGVKDSGTLIPGHGGILDRVDGLTFTIPLFAMLAAISLGI